MLVARASDGYSQYPDPYFVERDANVNIVVSGLLTKGHDIWVRVNLVNGQVGQMPIPSSEFHYHPDEREPTDVAVCPMNMYVRDDAGNSIEMDAVSLILNGEGGFLPSDEFRRQYMGRGGEISIIGLFRSHFGANKNIPIVRVGNISMLPAEPVSTKFKGYIKAYLVEARSIGGLSGSPVFAHADPAFELSKALTKQERTGPVALLGLMHGHFDIPNLNEDVVTDEDEPKRSIHTGIGVVIPVEKIVETIQHPDLIAMRKKIVKRLREEGGATSDLATDDASDGPAPATDANPKHREDFNSLVGAAVRKQKQDDQT